MYGIHTTITLIKNCRDQKGWERERGFGGGEVEMMYVVKKKKKTLDLLL